MVENCLAQRTNRTPLRRKKGALGHFQLPEYLMLGVVGLWEGWEMDWF